MLKNTSFAVVALAFALAMVVFATSSVVGNSASISRPKAGPPHVASVAAFLPVKALEPAW